MPDRYPTPARGTGLDLNRSEEGMRSLSDFISSVGPYLGPIPPEQIIDTGRGRPGQGRGTDYPLPADHPTPAVINPRPNPFTSTASPKNATAEDPETQDTVYGSTRTPIDLHELLGRRFVSTSDKKFPTLQFSGAEPENNLARFHNTKDWSPFESTINQFKTLIRQGALQEEPAPGENLSLKAITKRILQYWPRE